MKQSEAFTESEADAWYARNRDRLGKRDPVAEALASTNIEPKRILEIGCADGWRLEDMRRAFACEVYGVEPSMAACQAARIPIFQSTADALPFRSGQFDLVIYGFCLYVVDVTDWMKVAAEGDRVLSAGGYLVIHDFASRWYQKPFARKYEHRDGLLSYHYDFSKLWLANPLYSLELRHYPNDEECVTVLKKLPVDSIEVRA